MEVFLDYGYTGLFIASFLAATILPLSSELVFAGLLLNDLPMANLVIIATAGNSLGSATNYALGYWASQAVIQKYLKISDEEFVKAEQRYVKYGTFSLLFAWVPVIGDPLTVIAGVLRINVMVFLLLVTTGKFARYLAVGYMASP